MGVGNWVIAYMLINRAIHWDFWKKPLVCCNRIWAKASLSHVSKEKIFILLLERGAHKPYFKVLVMRERERERERASQVLGRLGLSLGPKFSEDLELCWASLVVKGLGSQSVGPSYGEDLALRGPQRTGTKLPYAYSLVWWIEFHWAWVTQNHPKNKGHQHCLY